MIYKKRSLVAHLPRWQALSTHVVFLASVITGVLYYLSHELAYQLLPVENHLILMLHGVAAYLFLICFGSLMPTHIRTGWKSKRNKVSGSTLLIAICLLLVSGLLLYYADELRDLALWVHWIVGGLMLVAFPVHVVMGWRTNYFVLKQNRLHH